TPEPHSPADARAGRDAESQSRPDTDRHGDRYTVARPDAGARRNANTHPEADTDLETHADADTETNANAYAYPDTHPVADPPTATTGQHQADAVQPLRRSAMRFTGERDEHDLRDCY
ncbi:MAG: hypothetical protein ABI620_06605, partial [Chloroflexota bacterium]